MKQIDMKLSHSTTLPLKEKQKIMPSVLAACLGVFIAYLPITLVATSLSPIGHSLAAPISALQWVQDAFAIAMAIIILPAGAFCDLIGRKTVYLIALILLACGSLLAFTAQTVQVLWIGQFVTGLGAGALLPGTLAILNAAVLDPRRRVPLIGVWASCLSLGLLLGPFVAGSVLLNGDWHQIFLPLIPLALLIFVWAARFVPESSSREGSTLDLPGQVTATLSIAALIFGIIEGSDQGWGAKPVVGSFILCGCSSIMFVIVESRSRSPLLHLSLFRSTTFTTTSLVAILAMSALIGSNFVLSLFFGVAQQLSPLDIALRFLILNGVTVLIGPLVGSIQRYVGARWLLTLGLLLAGSALLSMIGVATNAGFGDISWRLALLAVGFGLILTPMTAATAAAVPRPLAGMAATANNAFLQIGGALGPAVLGAILSIGAIQHLSKELEAVHVPASVHNNVLNAAHVQGISAARVMPFGPYTEQVHYAISSALTSSMHIAIATSGITLLIASLITFIFLRSPAPVIENQGHTLQKKSLLQETGRTLN